MGPLIIGLPAAVGWDLLNYLGSNFLFALFSSNFHSCCLFVKQILRIDMESDLTLLVV